MVFQNYALYPHMTRREEPRVRPPPAAHPEGGDPPPGGRGRRGCSASATCSSRRPGQLSGGQRQRVAMGRALVREPAVFLLDEPLSNLDAQLRVQMRAELKTLHARLGITTIYVTHDQTEAMTLGDRIAVMSRRQAPAVRAPQDVYDRPDERVRRRVHRVAADEPAGARPWTGGSGRRPRGRGYADRPGAVIVGIRPEAMRPVSDDDPGPGFEVSVDVAEPLGDEVLVHGTVEARTAGVQVGSEETAILPAEHAERAVVTVRVEPRLRPSPGEHLHVSIDPREVHLFDEATGERLPS